mgnify:CR=1 FL=1
MLKLTKEEQERIDDFMFEFITGIAHVMTDKGIADLCNIIWGKDARFDEEVATPEAVAEMPDGYRDFVCSSIGDYITLYGSESLLRLFRFTPEDILKAAE